MTTWNKIWQDDERPIKTNVRVSGRDPLYPCIYTEGRRKRQKPVGTASVQDEIRTGYFPDKSHRAQIRTYISIQYVQEIRGSQGCNYEACCRLGCDAV